MSQPINDTKTNTISQIHTSCKECVFALYENITQYGCSMGLIDKYKAKDTHIIEAYDEEKEFYILDKRKCVGFRKNSWFDQFNESLDIEQKKQKVLETFKIKYTLVVDLKNLTIESFESLLNDISNLDIKPKKIILIRYNYTNKIFDYDYIKQMLEKSNLNCAWRLQTMLDENVGLRNIISNTISTNPNNKYLIYVNNYTNKINEIVNKANSLIFDDLSSFIAVSDSEYNATLFLGILYRYVWHTEQKNIIENKNGFIIV